MSGTDRDAPWYRDGLRFSCTQCGNCCTGGEGAVWFTESEGRAMAEDLGMPHGEFLQAHARTIDGRWSLNESRTEHGYDCVFLDRTTQPGKALCRVYRSRPVQCRTWPFWDENLTSRRAWDSARRRTPCPGMDTGQLIPIEQIRIQRDLDRQDNADAPW